MTPSGKQWSKEFVFQDIPPHKHTKNFRKFCRFIRYVPGSSMSPKPHLQNALGLHPLLQWHLALPEKTVLESDQIKKHESSSRRMCITWNSGLAFSLDKQETRVLVDKQKPQIQTFKQFFNLAPHSPTTCNHCKNTATTQLLISSLWVCFRIVRMPSAAFICWSSCHMISLPQHDKRWNPSTNSLQKIWRDKLIKICPEEIGLRSWKISEHSILSRSIPAKRNWLW